MSTREQGAESPIVETRDDLIRWIAAGEKARADWRIGTEHEKFAFHTDDLSPVPYEGERGIGNLMRQFIDRFGWLPIEENGQVIALKRPSYEKGGTISLEPGGQFELSGAPLENVHLTAEETEQHRREIMRVGEDLAIGFIGIGFTPKWQLSEVPLMPKARYNVMMQYMPSVGRRGLDMMFRTATIQVNLDFGSEADMVKKMRVSLALQPIATALFAASPFEEGRPNGFQSLRSEVWRDTDPNRTGMLPFVFEDGMGYERYVDYALDVPMYFVYRNGKYIDVSGQSFRDFLEGKLPGLMGQKPTEDDWSDHLTTLFPEVRMKRFLEMRGADGGRWHTITALPAFWAGILYDENALNAADDMIRDWTAQERETLRAEVTRHGLRTPFRQTTVQQLARRALAIARQGLVARRRLDRHNRDETIHLAPIERVAETNETVSDRLLELYRTSWNSDIDRVFEEQAF